MLIEIKQTQDRIGLLVISETTNAVGDVKITSTNQTGQVLRVEGNNLTTGTTAFMRNYNSGSTGKVLFVQNNGTGNALYARQHNSGKAVDIGQYAESSEDAVGLYVDVDNAGTGNSYAAVFKRGNVGIGISEPEYKLSVYDKIYIYGNNPSLIINDASASDIEWLMRNQNSYLKLYTRNTSGTDNSNNPAIIIDPSANVGIGTGTAVLTEKLEVNGTIKATAFVGDGSGLTNLPTGSGSSIWTQSGSNVSYSAGNVGIGTTSPAQKLHVSGTVKASYFEGDGSKLTNLPTGSSVWTQSGDKISYSGEVSADGDIRTSSVYKISSSTVLSLEGSGNTFVGDTGTEDNAGDDNTFVGEDAGGSNSSGDSNTFVGMTSGSENTDGSQNTFIGGFAGWKNRTGDDNTFVGYSSGTLNTIGEKNTFMGYHSGNSNTTGKNNTFIGADAGTSNTEGSDNVFIGHGAGSTETGSDKLYIANSGGKPLIYGEFDNKIVAINGTTKTQEIIVENETWPDYVFEDDYRPMPLDELEKSIRTNGHLPDIPSAEEVKNNGVNVGEMQAKLLQKIEELTLHVIDQNKKLEKLAAENQTLKKRMASLQK